MAVVIRMKKTGRKNAPSFRISVSDSRRPRDGRMLDILGQYDPRAKLAEKQLALNVERARHWLAQGAQPSETIVSIFKKMGVFEGPWPKRQPRARPGRSKTTKARQARRSAKSARIATKAERYKARVAQRRANKKAAAPAAE